ncbi:MAG: PA2169 family four-helix-bundle protein [Clostridium sp.]
MAVNNDVKEMNKFLKGIHMGGTTFKDYLHKAKSPELKNELVQIIESFKRHEEAITGRIEKLEGNAADTLGVLGTMADFFEKIKLIPVNTDLEVCNHAVDAMEMGIKQGRKFIDENKDLDPSLMKEVEGVVADYDNHLRKIQGIIKACK